MLHVKFGRIVFLVVAMAAVGQFANTIYVPALTLIAHGLHIRPELVQTLMTAYLLPYGLTQFVYGPLSDVYGRRPMVLLGLAIFLGGSLLTVLATRFITLLVGCLIQGVGAGVFGVMARTVMRDCYADHKLYRANAIISLALIFAPLAAPVIGGLLAAYLGWRSDFVFLMFLCGFVLSLEYYLFPETHLQRQTTSFQWRVIKQKYLRAFAMPIFNGYMLCLALSFGGVAVFEASAGVLLTNILHFSPKVISLLFIIPIPGYMLGSYLASFLNKTHSIETIMQLSLVVIIAGIVLLSWPAWTMVLNVYVILIPITVFLFGAGLLFPTAVTGALNPLGDIAGTAGAILGGVQNICAAAMTACFSFIPQSTQRPLALMLDIAGVLLIVCYITLLHGRKPQPHNVAH